VLRCAIATPVYFKPCARIAVNRVLSGDSPVTRAIEQASETRKTCSGARGINAAANTEFED
jgi:hypothetical protein